MTDEKPADDTGTVVLILDRWESRRSDETEGKVRCNRCGQWCWLDQDQKTAIVTGKAQPLCLPCAMTLASDGTLGEFLGRVEDGNP